jgi:(1->4)-alpha-D-glucan 1-alpha-D-glucosylmutase
MPSGRRPHRPAGERDVPISTYRLQIQPAFTFHDAAEQADYLAALGVSHAYLSPILQPAPGSTHGYDVVNHEFVNQEAGGEHFTAAMAALHDRGLGVVVDVVPNHMTTPTPAWLNLQWWSLLRDGQQSPFAHWFDVDWAAEDGRVLVPVLGATVDAVLAADELSLAHDGGPHSDETVLRYFEHSFPVKPGTEGLELVDLVDAQSYRLCHWREGSHRLNYRRFFDVTTLIALCVEDPDVFDGTHRLLLEAYQGHLVDGFRIDHPDGLADPRRYLALLAEAAGDPWVVVEKILEGHEELPADWSCAGTTGYDALLRVGGVFVDPEGEAPLTALLAEVSGEEVDLDDIILAAKQQVVTEVQAAEVNRLRRLLARLVGSHDQAGLRRALEALLVAMDRYRAYVVPDAPAPAEAVAVVDEAAARARERLSAADHESLMIVRDLVLGQGEAVGDPEAAREFIIRFQQTCGPVMAKAVEDTAFYRYARLTSLNEVGGDPRRFGIAPAELHDFALRQLASWPTGMTTLSTHDTKRSEDVRARLGVLSEMPEQWADWARRARELAKPHRDDRLDEATEYFLWQTVVGAWPIDTERLQEYATKAIREAKQHTTWTDPDAAYEQAVARFVQGITTADEIADHIAAWVAETAEASRVAILGQKLLQLVLPGVPDVYQGSELVDLSLVDPDNRRLVDYGARRARMAHLDEGGQPRDLDDEKLLVTSRVLRMRREQPGWFVGERATYERVITTSDYAIALRRADGEHAGAVAVATRLAVGLRNRGGWGDATVLLPEPGSWIEIFTGRRVETDTSGLLRLDELLTTLPVALLWRHDSLVGDESA